MAEDIFKGNTEFVIGGPGRYLVAASGTTKPTRISEIMAIAWPFQPKSPWTDLGYTKEGLKIVRGHESMEHKVDQVKGALDETVTAWSHKIETSLAETSVDNLKLAWEGGTIDDHSTVAQVSTTTTAEAAAGQKVVAVTSAAGLVVGKTATIGSGNTLEAGIIALINGLNVTMQDNLLYTHASSAAFVQVAEKAFKELPLSRPTELTERLFAGVFMKPGGLLRAFVFWRTKLSAEDVELGPNTYEDDNTVPLKLTAYEDATDGTLQDDEKICKIFDEYVSS